MEHDHKELREWLERQIDLFQHPGWKDFVAEVTQLIPQLENARFACPESLPDRQGQLKILDILKNWEAETKDALDRLAALEAEVAEAA